MTSDERAFLKRLGFVHSAYDALRWVMVRGRGETTELTVWVERGSRPGSDWTMTFWNAALAGVAPFKSPDLTTLLVWAEVEGILGECR